MAETPSRSGPDAFLPVFRAATADLLKALTSTLNRAKEDSQRKHPPRIRGEQNEKIRPEVRRRALLGVWLEPRQLRAGTRPGHAWDRRERDLDRIVLRSRRALAFPRHRNGQWRESVFRNGQ